ncbi:hypothetical protein AGMMS49938_03110 [Fibrobacterales bacterium]|nr:hypothetical protein AGMMS49938_03110 [Fibrobacterales bacterium]
MSKFLLHIAALLAVACSTTQIGVKENWIDEHDVIALVSSPVDAWIAKVGTPTLVEIHGDTALYYYNYRPTLYAAAKYDSTTFFATWGTALETKPEAGNATEIWGSRKDVMQIRVINNTVLSAVITEGPDKKIFVRDLNGDLVIDPTSGYVPDVSAEQKIDKKSSAFNKTDSVIVEQARIKKEPAVLSPWEEARYRQEKSEERAKERVEQLNPEQK